MQVKYVGPKPLISETGISFDSQHDDRYTYLNIAVQLLQALDHHYFEEKTYYYAVDSQRLSDNEIVEGLKTYCSDLETMVQQSIDTEQSVIDSEIRRAKEKNNISEEAKEILLKNIEIMRNYRLQYATNETLYNCAVRSLAKQVRQEHIDYIVVPLFQRFAAVLHSVQDELSSQKVPLDSKMEIYEEDGKLMARMEVRNS